MKVVAGDVGATKSLLALIETDGDDFSIVREGRFESATFPGLGEMVAAFLEGEGGVDRACFGVPGPVTGPEISTPNLPWTIQEATVAGKAGIGSVLLVNDFAAICRGILNLGPEDLATIQSGKPRERGAMAVLGAGTGLGQGYLLWEGERYEAHVSEGGHADFAPHDDLEWGLLNFLKAQYGHVSWERVLSGPGLVNIYTYLEAARLAPGCPEVRGAIDAGGDAAPVISAHALAGGDEACIHALDLFAGFYGAEAGNTALEVLATGGMYIAGGIAPKILDKLRDGTMLRAFLDKGRFENLMEEIPLHVVTNEAVGLLGAAALAAEPAGGSNE